MLTKEIFLEKLVYFSDFLGMAQHDASSFNKIVDIGRFCENILLGVSPALLLVASGMKLPDRFFVDQSPKKLAEVLFTPLTDVIFGDCPVAKEPIHPLKGCFYITEDNQVRLCLLSTLFGMLQNARDGYVLCPSTRSPIISFVPLSMLDPDELGYLNKCFSNQEYLKISEQQLAVFSKEYRFWVSDYVHDNEGIIFSRHFGLFTLLSVFGFNQQSLLAFLISGKNFENLVNKHIAFKELCDSFPFFLPILLDKDNLPCFIDTLLARQPSAAGAYENYSGLMGLFTQRDGFLLWKQLCESSKNFLPMLLNANNNRVLFIKALLVRLPLATGADGNWSALLGLFSQPAGFEIWHQLCASSENFLPTLLNAENQSLFIETLLARRPLAAGVNENWSGLLGLFGQPGGLEVWHQLCVSSENFLPTLLNAENRSLFIATLLVCLPLDAGADANWSGLMGLFSQPGGLVVWNQLFASSKDFLPTLLNAQNRSLFITALLARRPLAAGINANWSGLLGLFSQPAGFVTWNQLCESSEDFLPMLLNAENRALLVETLLARRPLAAVDENWSVLLQLFFTKAGRAVFDKLCETSPDFLSDLFSSENEEKLRATFYAKVPNIEDQSTLDVIAVLEPEDLPWALENHEKFQAMLSEYKQAQQGVSESRLLPSILVSWQKRETNLKRQRNAGGENQEQAKGRPTIKKTFPN